MKIVLKVHRLVSTLLVLALLVLSASPIIAGAAPREPKPHPGIGNGQPSLEPGERAKLDRDSEIVAKALSFKKHEKKVEHDRGKTKDLAPDQLALVEQFVADINDAKIGIAVVEEDGTTTVYGNPKAAERVGDPSAAVDLSDQNGKVHQNRLHAMNKVWVNWQGVHIYVDAYWTNLLKDLNGWAVSVIAGAITAALCGTGVGCFATATIVTFVWEFIVWRIARTLFPDSFTVHAPWWGYVTVQPWKSGAWYNGYYFRSWLWT